MRAVNLLPRDERQARLEGKRAPLLVAVGGIVVVTAAAVFLGHSASSSTSEKQTQLDSVEAAIARLPKAAAPTVSTSAIAQERNDRVAALSAAISGRLAFDRLLRQMSLVLPSDAWLTGLKASVPTTAAPAVGTNGAPAPASSAQEGVTIEGATYSQESVARVLSRLALLPSLQDVRLTASAQIDPSQSSGADSQGGKKPAVKKSKKVVTFTIAASLRAGAPSS
jgi:Tfp pilus assembly protein PilN